MKIIVDLAEEKNVFLSFLSRLKASKRIENYKAEAYEGVLSYIRFLETVVMQMNNTPTLGLSCDLHDSLCLDIKHRPNNLLNIQDNDLINRHNAFDSLMKYIAELEFTVYVAVLEDTISLEQVEMHYDGNVVKDESAFG